MGKVIRGTPIAAITTMATIMATITSTTTMAVIGAIAIATDHTDGRPWAASPLVQSGTVRKGSLVNLDERVAEDEYRAVGRSHGASHSLWIATKPEGLLASLPGALLVVRLSLRPPATETGHAGGLCLRSPDASPRWASSIIASLERASDAWARSFFVAGQRRSPAFGPSFLLRITGRGVRFTRLGRLAAPSRFNLCEVVGFRDLGLRPLTCPNLS
jgi:hypothetical protein